MWPVLAFAVMAVARWGASFSPPLLIMNKLVVYTNMCQLIRIAC